MCVIVSLICVKYTHSLLLLFCILQESIAIAKLKKTLLEMTGNIHLYKTGTEYVVFKADRTNDNMENIGVEDIA